jgi:hypothetical protein
MTRPLPKLSKRSRSEWDVTKATEARNAHWLLRQLGIRRVKKAVPIRTPKQHTLRLVTPPPARLRRVVEYAR